MYSATELKASSAENVSTVLAGSLSTSHLNTANIGILDQYTVKTWQAGLYAVTPVQCGHFWDRKKDALPGCTIMNEVLILGPPKKYCCSPVYRSSVQ